MKQTIPFRLFTYLAVLLIAPAVANAHLVGGSGSGSGSGIGIGSGIAHPLLGLDHLLAMVAVGVVSVIRGGRALWQVPAAFVGSMVLGGMLAILGVRLPAVETFIAVSVLVLGVAIALSKKMQKQWAMLCIGVFAIFHGHAHGEELPLIANAAQYIAGFVVSTTALHASGVAIGHFSAKSRLTATMLRYAGAAMAAAGVVFLFNL